MPTLCMLVNRNGSSLDIRFDPNAQTPIYSLRARAVCIDMEEGVLNGLKRSHLGELFDANQFVKDVSGAGNNWAHGHCCYGPQYSEDIIDTVQRTLLVFLGQINREKTQPRLCIKGSNAVLYYSHTPSSTHIYTYITTLHRRG